MAKALPVSRPDVGSFSCEEIAGVFGLLGGGKSYFALERFIWPELLDGKRAIVTNHKLLASKLREAIQNHSDSDGNEVVNRVRLLSDDDMRQFWLYRGVDPKTGDWWSAKDVTVLEKGARGEAAINDYNASHDHARPPGGVLYVYDEAHFGLRARDWMSFGRTGEWYFNHVRKQRDSVILCTPHPDQLDKYVRNLLQNVYMVRNGGKERFKSLFRGPRRIFWDCYLGPYQKTMPKQCGGMFQIKTWLADCYDTSGGAGLEGGGVADKGNKPKGLPFWMLPAGGVVALLLVAFFPMAMVRGFSGWIGSIFPDTKKKPVAAAVAPAVPKFTKHVELAVSTNAPSSSRRVVVADSSLGPLRVFKSYTCNMETRKGVVVAWDDDILDATEISLDGRRAIVAGQLWQFRRSTNLPPASRSQILAGGAGGNAVRKGGEIRQ